MRWVDCRRCLKGAPLRSRRAGGASRPECNIMPPRVCPTHGVENMIQVAQDAILHELRRRRTASTTVDDMSWEEPPKSNMDATQADYAEKSAMADYASFWDIPGMKAGVLTGDVAWDLLRFPKRREDSQFMQPITQQRVQRMLSSESDALSTGLL